MEQLITGKLAVHDRYQFELKLGYSLNPDLHRNNYHIEMYLFMPRSLGINRHSYRKNDFYNDIQNYIRFKTPDFTFDNLLDPNNERSPLTRIEQLLNTTRDRKKLIAEMKLFACTVRVALRSSVTRMRKKIRGQETTDIENSLRLTCNGLTNCLERFRGLAARLDEPAVHKDVKFAWRDADEYIGIAVDALLNSFHNTIVDSFLDKGLTSELNAVIIPIIAAEYKYRKEKNYATYDFAGDNEYFLHRKGILKKLITNLLFLDMRTQEGGALARDAIFAVSAGIAMIIATAVTIWAGLRWGATSIPFVLAIVIGYMVKDRIKEWMKVAFSRKMTHWLSDYKTIIIDPATDKKIGVCRQAFSFVGEKNVPLDILNTRRLDIPSEFCAPEETIKYEKAILLLPRPVLKAHARLRDITDIIRFNVHSFLERMDEPFETRRAMDPLSGNTMEFRCARVYHINVILKLEKEIRRLRLVLNQNGIRRIEEVK